MTQTDPESDRRSGLALSQAEIWLLLHALKRAEAPAIGWDGNPLEPWTLGELGAKLRRALSPEAIASGEARPAIVRDSQMGRDLERFGITPLVAQDVFDIGSLIDACARRGWGVELNLPTGASQETPASARVTVAGSGDEATFVGLEEPVVALARALIGALVATGGVPASTGGGEPAPLDSTGQIGDERYEEQVIWATAIQQGRKPRVIAKMARDGWELVRDEGNGPGDQLVFRRHP